MLAKTYADWDRHNAMRMGAALAFYSILSIAPLVILTVAIIGLVYGSSHAQEQIANQVEALVGPEGKTAVTTMIESAHKPSSGALASDRWDLHAAVWRLRSLQRIAFGAESDLGRGPDEERRIHGVGPGPIFFIRDGAGNRLSLASVANLERGAGRSRQVVRGASPNARGRSDSDQLSGPHDWDRYPFRLNLQIRAASAGSLAGCVDGRIYDFVLVFGRKVTNRFVLRKSGSRFSLRRCGIADRRHCLGVLFFADFFLWSGVHPRVRDNEATMKFGFPKYWEGYCSGAPVKEMKTGAGAGRNVRRVEARDHSPSA